MTENPLDAELDRTDSRLSAAVVLMGVLIFAVVLVTHAVFGVRVAFPLLLASLPVAAILYALWFLRLRATRDLHARFEPGDTR